MWRNMGRRNARVLPLPVLAMPIMSRPDITVGTACAWIGVGRSKLFLENGKIFYVELK